VCQRRELWEQVGRALEVVRGQVPERSLRAFEMRRIEGRSVDEVAEALGLTREVVRYRTYRVGCLFEAALAVSN
jgi:DNA-directed RNA polymerase specialized sigma24 family protein